jgi:hypothetical protein
VNEQCAIKNLDRHYSKLPTACSLASLYERVGKKRDRAQISEQDTFIGYPRLAIQLVSIPKGCCRGAFAFPGETSIAQQKIYFAVFWGAHKYNFSTMAQTRTDLPD